VIWLQSLEQLIDRNMEWFVAKGMGDLLPYWYQEIIVFLIQHQRGSVMPTKKSDGTNSDLGLENGLFENPFDIKKVKRYQYYLNTGIYRIEYLMRMEMNYLHNQDKYLSTDGTPFNEQIRLEISYQDYEESFFKEQEEKNKKEKFAIKFQVNGSIQLLALAFKKMIEHPGIGGEPFLKMTPNEAVHFLLNHTEQVEKQHKEEVDEKEMDRALLYEIFLNEVIIPQKKPLSLITPAQYYEFDIEQVIKTLSTIRSIDYKMLFLMRVRTNFLQDRSIKKTDFSFEKRIDEEIDYQERMHLLREKKYEATPDKIKQFHINGQLNVFMDVFYELKNEIGADEKRFYLTNSKKDLARLLSKYFYDKNCFMLKPVSLYSYFKPSHVLKRCPIKKRIHFKPEQNI